MLAAECRAAWKALGRVSYGPTGVEKGSVPYRRSLYIVRDLKKGDVLTPENLRSIRPGLGLAPRFLEQLLGRKVVADVKRGTPARWDLV